MKVFMFNIHYKKNNEVVELSNEEVVELSNEVGELNNEIIIMPEIYHTVSSEEGCKFLIFTSNIFDPDNPDTYKK